MKLRFTLLLGVFLALSGFAAYAQQTTGELTGTVTDSSGAVVPGATVTATDIATHQVRTTTSNETGNYVIPYLTPGNYNLQITKTGFQTENQANLAVTVGAVVRLDFKMEIGDVTTQVEVTTAAPLLSTESAAVQTDIGGQQIVSLPLNGRDYLQLVALTPNVVAEQGPATGGGGLQGGLRSQEAIAIAGQRLEFNHYTLDGVENTDPNFNSYIIHPSVDALQEFTVLTGVYSAEFGRGAGQVNATTLPGSNQYHGVAYDFIRNDYVDAKLWHQSGAKNPFHREDYGFTLDGPMSIPHLFNAKDKLFFASSFEALRDNEFIEQTGSVPTQDMRAGNLGVFGIGNGSGQIPQLYYPKSRVFVGSSGTATPVSGNVIPSTSISPQAAALMAYEPLPNQFGGPTEETSYANDLKTESLQATQETQFNQRIDWTENQRSNWFGRFSWESDAYSPSTLIPVADEAETLTTVRQAVIGNTFIVNQHMVNDARFAWDQFNNNYEGYYANSSNNVQAGLGIQGLSAAGSVDYGIPDVGLTQGMTAFGGQVPYITRDDLFQWIDSLSIIKGNHSIKVGGMFQRDRYNQFGNQKAVGEFDFDGQSTDLPGNLATGWAFGDFLFGDVSQYYRVTSLAQAELRRPDYSAFLQDDWKATHNLTLNLGIRYDNQRPWIDKHDAIMNVDVPSSGVYVPPAAAYAEPQAVVIPDSTNYTPIYTRPGAAGCNFYNQMNFQFAETPLQANGQPQQPTQCGDQYMGRSTMNPNNLDFGPRIGLNYALGTKWSFRTGFGIYYTNDIGNSIFDMARNLGGKDGAVVANNARSVNLSSPWASEIGSPACAPYTGPCISAPQIQAARQNNRSTYVEQYMFNAERQLTKNVSIELAYMGNESHHLLRDLIVNQAVPKVSPTDTSSTASRRPFPTEGPIQQMADWDQGVYNSGDVKLTQRVSHGLLYVVAFTWSRSIDSGSAIRNNTGDTLWPTNSYNLAEERGPSQFNLPRRFVGSFVYDLPVGAGRGYVPSNAIANHVISGWSVGGILTLADGTSMNPTQLGDTSGLGTLGNQPNYTGASYTAGRSVNQFWNPAAFDYGNTAASSQYLGWREGTMRRDTLYTPGQQDFDANIARTFHIWESHTLEFRLEAFNALNHPNWEPPASTNTTNLSTFGKVTTAYSMRELQGALKYNF